MYKERIAYEKGVRLKILHLYDLPQKEARVILTSECKARRGTPPRVWFLRAFFYKEVTVKINGKVVKLSGPEPLVDVLIRAGYDASGVVLEMNGVLVKRADMANTVVDDEDVLEVFSFTGGG